MHWDNFWLGYVFGVISLAATSFLTFIYLDSRNYAKGKSQTRNNEE